MVLEGSFLGGLGPPYIWAGHQASRNICWRKHSPRGGWRAEGGKIGRGREDTAPTLSDSYLLLHSCNSMTLMLHQGINSFVRLEPGAMMLPASSRAVLSPSGQASFPISFTFPSAHSASGSAQQSLSSTIFLCSSHVNLVRVTMLCDG